MSHTWLLLRGLTRESRHWGEFPQQLALKLGVETVCVDLPGNGQLAHQPSPTDLAETLTSVRCQLADCGRQGPFTLVAMSMGAMLGCLWAARYPTELAGAVLINTSMRPFSAWYRRLRTHNYPRLLNMAISGAGEAWEANVLRMTSRRFDPEAEDGQRLLRLWLQVARSAPVTRVNAWRQLRAALGYSAPQRAPEVPLLLLSSVGDQLVDPRCSVAVADAWSLPHQRHPWAGHDLPLDAPDWVIAQIRVWQNEVSRQDRGG